MSWVGVRYRGIALPDIMKVMQVWLNQRGIHPADFDFVISGSGTLVCAQFAEAFSGFVTQHRPELTRNESAEVADTADN